jgi:hypothetical protein
MKSRRLFFKLKTRHLELLAGQSEEVKHNCIELSCSSNRKGIKRRDTDGVADD